MKIEVGKCYRMRNGGAIKIERLDGVWFLCAPMGWVKSGRSISDFYDAPFDLVSEITEAEYNRIVSGEASNKLEIDACNYSLNIANKRIDNLIQDLAIERSKNKEAYKSAVLDTAETALAKMSEEIDALKKQLAETIRMYQGAQIQVEEMWSDRRERIATAAMQGMIGNATGSQWVENLVSDSVKVADALIKALEEGK
jgi:hypothetical protein